MDVGFLAFVSALAVTIVLVPMVRFFAVRGGVVDRPILARKVHRKNIPLLGGVAVFAAYFLVLGALAFWYPHLFEKIPAHTLIALFLAGLVLMVGGYLDDRFSLKASRQIFFPIVATSIAMIGGVLMQKVTNPFGEVFVLTSVLALPLTFLWLMGMMYTTKFLDGLDGLATGITAIGAIMIFALTRTEKFFQPDVGALAAILAGVCLGFLLFNFHPAKIFLGEGGSVLLGFLLGVLAIISGSKIATTLLVMGIPILDVLWVLARRWWQGVPVTQGDDQHLHYRFLKKGFSHRATVLCMYSLSALFGVLTLFLQSSQKLIALLILLFVMIVLVAYLLWDSSGKKKSGR